MRDESRPLAMRFAEAAPNPGATAEIDRLSRASMSVDGGIPLAVECRGAICRIAPAPDAPASLAWMPQLQRAPWFQAKGKNANMGAGGILLETHEPEVAATRQALVEYLRAFKATGAPSLCARLSPAGRIDAEVVYGRAGEASESDLRFSNGAWIRLQGPLLASKAGACLRERLKASEDLMHIPEDAAAASISTVFQLPPAPR